MRAGEVGINNDNATAGDVRCLGACSKNRTLFRAITQPRHGGMPYGTRPLKVRVANLWDIDIFKEMILVVETAVCVERRLVN